MTDAIVDNYLPGVGFTHTDLDRFLAEAKERYPYVPTPPSEARGVVLRCLHRELGILMESQQIGGVTCWDEIEGTAIEDHVRDLAQAIQSLEAEADGPQANPAGEALYRASLDRSRAEHPEDHHASSLEDALRFCDRWMPEAMPANDKGQIPFGRALLETALDAIRAHLDRAAQRIPGPPSPPVPPPHRVG